MSRVKHKVCREFYEAKPTSGTFLQPTESIATLILALFSVCIPDLGRGAAAADISASS